MFEYPTVSAFAKLGQYPIIAISKDNLSIKQPSPTTNHNFLGQPISLRPFQHNE
ncbi:hypothetical protein [Serratia sp. (in: enterobacteria)]|uniref:hypothetical protein n=1 Tax=Serratia sp. (in: enterobacteria) TaxID=616 RepID=UPI003988C41C